MATLVENGRRLSLNVSGKNVPNETEIGTRWYNALTAVVQRIKKYVLFQNSRIKGVHNAGLNIANIGNLNSDTRIDDNTVSIDKANSVDYDSIMEEVEVLGNTSVVQHTSISPSRMPSMPSTLPSTPSSLPSTPSLLPSTSSLSKKRRKSSPVIVRSAPIDKNLVDGALLKAGDFVVVEKK